jgi:hypothetical protein
MSMIPNGTKPAQYIVKPNGFKSGEYEKLRVTERTKVGLDGKPVARFINREASSLEELNGKGYIVVNKTASRALLNAISAFFDAHADEFFEFEDHRAVLSKQCEQTNPYHQRVKDSSRNAFIREMLVKYAHEEYGSQVMYDEVNNGFVCANKRNPSREERTFIDTRSESIAATTRQEDGRSYMRHDPKLEPKWKVGDFVNMTVAVNYDIWRRNNYLPAKIMDDMVNRFESNRDEAIKLAEMIITAVANGDLLFEVANELGVSYSDIQQFVRKCRKVIPDFPEKFNEALDDGLEAFGAKVAYEMTSMVGVLRERANGADDLFDEEGNPLPLLSPKDLVSRIHAESKIMSDTMNLRRQQVTASKLSRYYMGPALASIGSMTTAPTIVMNFSAPALPASKLEVIEDIKEEVPSWLQ